MLHKETVQLHTKLKEKYPELAKIALYFCIGVSAAGVDVAMFIALKDAFGFIPELATVCSTFIAMIYAFTLNSFYTFKVKTHLWKRFISYFLVSVVGMILSVVMIWYFARIGGHDENMIKILSLPVIFVVQFLLNRFITFRAS